MIPHPNDDIWNEHEWETYIRTFEAQNQRMKSFYESVWDEKSPTWHKLLDELSSEKEIVDAFIEDELLIEESYFPDDDEEFEIDDDEDELDEDLFGFGSDSEDDDDDDLEEFELTDEDIFLSFEPMSEEDEEELELYDRAREAAISLLKWHQRRAREHKIRPEIERLVTIAMQIPTKIAAGFGFGFDPESIGGNIAYCKRALALCNESLDIINLLYNDSSMKKKSFLYLYEEIMLLRNDVGVYIQEMRDVLSEALGKFGE